MLSLVQRIKAICKMRAISVASLEQQIGIGANTIYTWDKVMPSADKILKAAQCLGVSTDSILGHSIDENSKTVADLEPATIELITELEQSELSTDSKDVLLDVIRSLKKHIG